MEVVLIRGAAAIGKSQLSVAYIGNGSSLDYLQFILFGDGEAKQERFGHCHVWDFGETALAIADRVDMVIIEYNSILTWKPPSGHSVVSQPWVRMVHDFAPGETWDQVKKRFRGQKGNVRRITRSGYTYRISHRASDFDYFYERMYLPYITDRHRGYAIVDDERYLRSFFRDGHLMIALREGDKPVAASLDMVVGNVYYGIATGVLDGDRRWVRDGALSALYYFEIMWCHENGIRRYDAGACRPFINDGIFMHKKRWGFRPIPNLWGELELMFWVPSGSQAALEWLSVYSFIPSACECSEVPLEMAAS